MDTKSLSDIILRQNLRIHGLEETYEIKLKRRHTGEVVQLVRIALHGDPGSHSQYHS